VTGIGVRSGETPLDPGGQCGINDCPAEAAVVRSLEAAIPGAEWQPDLYSDIFAWLGGNRADHAAERLADWGSA
jgi:hypothetical protein